MKTRIKRMLRKLISSFLWHSGIGNMHDVLLSNYMSDLARKSTNPLLKPVEGYFSQSDEDGIIKRIFSRLSTRQGTFVELGVGDGLENNTLNLLFNGWSGIWFGGERIELPTKCKFPDSLEFNNVWIDLDSLKKRVIPRILEAGPINLISLDLDGNDYYFVKAMLESGIAPDVWVQEYNGNFSVSTYWIQDYDPNHQWKEDMYFGASLNAYFQLFQSHGYSLIACNLLGINAFFVRDEFIESFSDVPTDIEMLYNQAHTMFLKTRQKRNSKTYLKLDS